MLRQFWPSSSHSVDAQRAQTRYACTKVSKFFSSMSHLLLQVFTDLDIDTPPDQQLDGGDLETVVSVGELHNIARHTGQQGQFYGARDSTSDSRIVPVPHNVREFVPAFTVQGCEGRALAATTAFGLDACHLGFSFMD